LPAVKVVYLSKHDTMQVVREIVRLTPSGAQLWLAVPWQTTWARNMVNHAVLRRVSEDANIDLRLVTWNMQTRYLAQAAGIPSYAFLPPALRKYRVQRRPDTMNLSRRIISVDEELAPRYRNRPKVLGLSAALLAGGAVAFLAIALAMTLALFVPRATIRLEPVSQRVSGILEVTSDPRYTTVDYEQAIVPGRSVQVIIEGRGETAATGSVEVDDGYASGEVVFVNRSDVPITVPKGTVVLTGTGTAQRYHTVDEVTVPGVLYAQARVGIISETPGLSGNASAWSVSVIEGALAGPLSVLNDVPVSGGTVRSVPEVTLQDLERLFSETMEALGAQAHEQLSAELEEGEFVPIDTLEVLVMSYEYESQDRDRSPVATMQMKVVARGTAVDGAGIEDLASRFLETLGGEGMGIIADSLTLGRSSSVRVDEELGTLRLTISAEGMIAPLIDVDHLKKDIAGKTLDSALAYLEEHLDLRQEPTVELSPAWWPFIPRLPARLQLDITARTWS